MTVTSTETDSQTAKGQAGGARFGEQRPAGDIAALALLLIGFTAMASAIYFLRETVIGVLLPLTYVAGAVAGLRTEVRQLELLPDRMILRTFFRSYAVPRAHITAVVMTDRGVAMDVLNGTRYPINPPGADPAELLAALRQWLQ